MLAFASAFSRQHSAVSRQSSAIRVAWPTAKAHPTGTAYFIQKYRSVPIRDKHLKDHGTGFDAVT
ncbi:hypothetical protein BJP36_38675 [Moorena producens JHB]|uniref:Uncharacterized protein n=1 Tax=Moorena producens (strain JHB) TaxID=1454205 RepID=A0A9Q9SUQ2_MOOP1|nr:hypothetical protein [Moorena producens]WAN69998.1 hypothetical protein BJP36_38675 [Moorena producens JHB]